MRAIILSAGEGSRLRPFTADKPKPMVRAANKPILQHVIEGLVANGVHDITIVAGYRREKIQSYFADGKKMGARIAYAFQDALTGTARALGTAPRPRDPFLVIGGDNVVDASLIKAALEAPAPAIVVHKSTRPQRYGVATFDGDRLSQIVEKPTQPKSEWVNTGVYSLTPDFHDRATAMAETPDAGIPDILQQAIVEGVKIRAVKSDALWSDAVYPWDLLRVHADLLHAQPARPANVAGVHLEQPVLLGQDAHVGIGSTLAAGTCIGNNVVIGPNCVLENCVVYDDVQIGAGSILRNTIVGAGTRIGPRFTAISGPCDVKLADGWHHLDDFGSVIGEDARLGGVVTLAPGTIVGNGAHVHHGKTIQGFMEDRSVAH